MITENLLEVDDLRTTFQTPRGAVCAVDGVSLTLKPGETLGIVGESGSGKSVLGRTIMGLISNGPTTSVTGSVRIAGQDVHALSAKRRRKLWGPTVAMVFQDPMTSLNPVKKIGTHITEALRLHFSMGKTEARDRAIELLTQVGIPEPTRRMTQYPHELSGGMRQRVVIAMALCCGPDLLIADEPTTALDVTVQKQILDLLASLSQTLNMATILISHDLGAVEGRTDRVQVMYAGRVVESSGTGTVFAEPGHPYAEALLASIPRMEDKPHTLLRAIDGTPPDMISPPPGCRFAPRCQYAQDRCVQESPPLLDHVGSANPHLIACHYPLIVPAPGSAAAAARTLLEETR
ncbi:Oligopeptide transport ATP-binding protein OppD [Nocardioides dokdonensis FR1436]|uniref:Oligopeptide transport ATP-binding protein OppD n=1 Tax=Nocardioides dokdonensis FR1436 TaxID=1300347 RepID=A0A1A9GFF2_9ACTN|nr:ABC transporter ATP-binding protein [Nocardioides dokdonensis]ANH37017.1 Oligopeptide transport ATP-binding protein OppD [Nocardioides dokdonensis FR1436]